MSIIKQWKYTLLVSIPYPLWVYYWGFADGQYNQPMTDSLRDLGAVWAIMLYGAIIAAVACWVDKVPIRQR